MRAGLKRLCGSVRASFTPDCLDPLGRRDQRILSDGPEPGELVVGDRRDVAHADFFSRERRCRRRKVACAGGSATVATARSTTEANVDDKDLRALEERIQANTLLLTSLLRAAARHGIIDLKEESEKLDHAFDAAAATMPNAGADAEKGAHALEIAQQILAILSRTQK